MTAAAPQKTIEVKPLPKGLAPPEPPLRDPNATAFAKTMSVQDQEKLIITGFTEGWKACEEERAIETARAESSRGPRGAPPPAGAKAETAVAGGHPMEAFPKLPEPKAEPAQAVEMNFRCRRSSTSRERREARRRLRP